MKTVLNKAKRPLKVHLPGDKVLHLGLGKEGQIGDHDADAPGVKKLLEAGDLEIIGEGGQTATGHPDSGGGHSETHGHHPDTSMHQRGDR